MQKNYNLVKASVLLLLLLIQNSLQAQSYCKDCQTEVKMISDKQFLLEKIEIKEGTTTTLNTNLYVSYRSGNAQKFWANLAIATAGVAISTQLQNNSSAEGNNLKSVSLLIPLGVSVATLPSIWKNRPRGVPQAGLWLQHRDIRGKLTDTWEQPISSEAKNSGELLSINIDKPLSAGTLEVYLQNGSKNPVYYWGYESSKTLVKSKGTIFGNPPVSFGLGCPDGYLSNGQGRCCNFFNGQCIDEPTGNPPTPTPTPTPVPQGCPSGYLPNGQGMCCLPGTSICVSEGNSGGNSGGQSSTETKTETVRTPVPVVNSSGSCPAGYLPNGRGLCCSPFSDACVNETPATPSTDGYVTICIIYFTRGCNADKTDCTPWRETDRECSTVFEPTQIGEDGPLPGNGSGGGGGSGITDCVGGHSRSTGQPCGVSICNNIDGRDQYGNGCGTPRCSAQSGLTQYGIICNTKIKIVDVKTPCLQAALAAIAQSIKNLAPDGDSFLSQLKIIFGENSNFNITFIEQDGVFSSAGGEVAAQCGDMVNGSVTILLNKRALPGMNANYQKAAILHEMMHAYMQADGYDTRHEYFLGSNFFDDFLFGAYRNLGFSVKEATALGLYGAGDLLKRNTQTGLYYTDSPNYERILKKYNDAFPNDRLNIQNVIQIGDLYANTTRDSQGKITKLGSSDCP